MTDTKDTGIGDKNVSKKKSSTLPNRALRIDVHLKVKKAVNGQYGFLGPDGLVKRLEGLEFRMGMQSVLLSTWDAAEVIKFPL